MKTLAACAFALLCCFAATGCATADKEPPPDRAALTPYDANCLHYWQLGRTYMGQGRFELAREQLLLALAASNSAETRSLLSHELRSVEMMIKTER
jgi:hypothetical protein